MVFLVGFVVCSVGGVWCGCGVVGVWLCLGVWGGGCGGCVWCVFFFLRGDCAAMKVSKAPEEREGRGETPTEREAQCKSPLTPCRSKEYILNIGQAKGLPHVVPLCLAVHSPQPVSD